MQSANASGQVIRVGPVYEAAYGSISPIAYAYHGQVPDMSLPLIPAMPDGKPFGQATLPDPGTGSINNVGCPMVQSFPEVTNWSQAPHAPAFYTVNSITIEGKQP